MIASAREFTLYVDVYRIGSAAAHTFVPATFPPGVVAPLGTARKVAEELRPGIGALAPDPAIYLRRSWSAPLAAQWINARTGVAYSTKHVINTIAALGMR